MSIVVVVARVVVVRGVGRVVVVVARRVVVGITIVVVVSIAVVVGWTTTVVVVSASVVVVVGSVSPAVVVVVGSTHVGRGPPPGRWKQPAPMAATMSTSGAKRSRRVCFVMWVPPREDVRRAGPGTGAPLPRRPARGGPTPGRTPRVSTSGRPGTLLDKIA